MILLKHKISITYFIKLGLRFRAKRNFQAYKQIYFKNKCTFKESFTLGYNKKIIRK